MENQEMAEAMVKCFLIGLECTLMLVFLICTIIDMKNTKKEWKLTENWIKSTELQHKFEQIILDNLNSQDNRLTVIEEKLGIKNEEENEDEQVNNSQEM